MAQLGVDERRADSTPLGKMDSRKAKRAAIPQYVIFFLVIAACLTLVVYVATNRKALSRSVDVDANVVVTDVADVTDMRSTVNAAGVLASTQVTTVSSPVAGVVLKFFVKPGQPVHAGSVIAQLANPSLMAASEIARGQLAASKAELNSTIEQAKDSASQRRLSYSDAEADLEDHKLIYESDQSLVSDGLISVRVAEESRIFYEKAQADAIAAKEQVAIAASEWRSKTDAALAQIHQAETQIETDSALVAALTVHANSDGVVQSSGILAGKSIVQGDELVQLADIRSIKAVLNVPEDDVHDVQPGMTVTIIGGSWRTRGNVARVAPNANEGNVAVDVLLERVPESARPQENVTGSIRVGPVMRALSILRPPGAVPNSTAVLYKLAPDHRTADRVQVVFGAVSDSRIQIRSGLRYRDSVIISDSAAYGDYTTIRLR